MTGPGRAPQIPDHTEPVREEWIDYNGHLSEAYYVLVFGHASDAMMVETGLGPDYRELSGCSLYTAEAHVRYLREVPGLARLTVRTRVLGVDAKKVRLVHEMFVGGGGGGGDGDGEGEGVRDSGNPVATTELLMIHVDQSAGRAAPFPDAVRARFASLTRQPPDWAGRSIGPVPRDAEPARPN